MAISVRNYWQQDGDRTSHSANAELVACSSPATAGRYDLQSMQSADHQAASHGPRYGMLGSLRHMQTLKELDQKKKKREKK